MNPEQSHQPTSLELPPVGGEFNRVPQPSPESGVPQVQPERGIFDNMERVEQRSEMGRSDSAPVNTSQAIVNNTTTVANDPAILPLAVSGTPLKARDTESIEKEWITKTKQVLTENKNDPYTKEEQVKSLKSNYLKERFGRVVGKDN